MADNKESNEVDSFQPQKLPASAYLVGALTQFALGLHSPFLQTYLVDMQTKAPQAGSHFTLVIPA